LFGGRTGRSYEVEELARPGFVYVNGVISFRIDIPATIEHVVFDDAWLDANRR